MANRDESRRVYRIKIFRCENKACADCGHEYWEYEDALEDGKNAPCRDCGIEGVFVENDERVL